MAIWATFVIEGGVIIALLVPKWRYYGIAVGVAFHMLLATSAYAFYPAFSTLSIMLHSLFLPPGTLERFRATKLGRFVLGAKRKDRNLQILLALFFIQLALSVLGILHIAVIPWFLSAIPCLLFVVQCARERDPTVRHSPALPRTGIGIIVVALFFANCFSPYLGLKSKQAINMFANLHLEDGRSNHLVITNPPFIAGYMNDVVDLQEVTNNAELAFYEKLGHRMVYYSLLDALERNHDTVVTYVRDGVVYSDQSHATMKAEIENTLHPRWVRKWLHFLSVSSQSPKWCALYH